MPNINEIRQDMDFMDNLGDIIDVFKAAAVLQHRSYSVKKRPNTDFMNMSTDFMQTLAEFNDSGPLFRENNDMPEGVIVLTSDEGFLGELNIQIIENAVRAAHKRSDKIFVYGQRGCSYFDDLGRSFVNMGSIAEDVRIDDLFSAARILMNGFGEEYYSLSVIYPEYLSVTMHKVVEKRLLPFPAQSDKKRFGPVFTKAVSFAPDPSAVEAMAAVYFLASRLRIIFDEFKLSEYSARIMHLERSSQELTEVNNTLHNKYFKLLHELNDKGIREITSARVAIKEWQ